MESHNNNNHSQVTRNRANEIAAWATQRMRLSDLLEQHKIKGVQEVGEFLLRTTQPHEIDRVQKQGLTPLMIACKGAQEELVTFLLENGADPNKSCFTERNTALHYACTPEDFAYCDGDLDTLPEELKKRTVIVQSLLNHGAILTLNGMDMNPLHMAAICGLKDTVELFVSSDSGVQISRKEEIKAFQLLGVSQVTYSSKMEDYIVKARGFFQRAADLHVSSEDSSADQQPDATDLHRCFSNGEYMQSHDGLEEERATWMGGLTLGAGILPDRFKREFFWRVLIELGADALYKVGWGQETGLKLLRYLIQLEITGQIEPGSVLENISQFFTEDIPDTPKPIVMRYLSLLLETYADGLRTVRGNVLRKYGCNITEHLGNMLSDIAYFHTRVRHLQSLVAASERIIVTINESIEVSKEASFSQTVAYRFSATAEFVINLYTAFWETGKLGRNRRTKDNVLFVLARLLRCDKASSRVLSYGGLQGFLGYSYLAVEDMDYFYAMVQLMVRYGCPLKNKNQNGLVPKKVFLRAVQRVTLCEADAPPFKRLFDLLSPSSNMLPLEELAARVIMSRRIPYQGKLPAGLAGIFEERYLGGNLTRVETEDEFSEHSGSENDDSEHDD